ncbi:MAG: hypothetical protein H0U58_03135 [Chloroflexi bacterium]|nr:hypothetical protein [Chloroflexota bacterium]
MREAPLGWLTAGAAILDTLDGRDALGALFDQTLLRANIVSQSFARQSPAVTQTNTIDWIVGVHGQAVAQRRATLVGANLNQLVLGSWSDGRAGASAIATLGDAMDATRAGRAAGMAAAELESIGRVAACLWAGFGRTPAGVRLAWARLLSQFDTPVNLRVLARLPRWGEVDRLLANELQALTDGVFGRFVTSVPNATTLANDLVRVCVLVAARAPVDRVVAGSIDRARRVRVGSRVPVTFPPLGDVRVGSFVWFRPPAVDPIEPPLIVGKVVDLVGSTHLVEIEHLQPFGGDPLEGVEMTLAADMRAEVISPALVPMAGRI